MYRISANSFHGNNSFLNLTFGHSTYRCGNYSRAETIRGNTVCLFKYFRPVGNFGYQSLICTYTWVKVIFLKFLMNTSLEVSASNTKHRLQPVFLSFKLRDGFMTRFNYKTSLHVNYVRVLPKS